MYIVLWVTGNDEFSKYTYSYIYKHPGIFLELIHDVLFRKQNLKILMFTEKLRYKYVEQKFWLCKFNASSKTHNCKVFNDQKVTGLWHLSLRWW